VAARRGLVIRLLRPSRRLPAAAGTYGAAKPAWHASWFQAHRSELVRTQHCSSRSVKARDDHRSSASRDGPNSRKGLVPRSATCTASRVAQSAPLVKCSAMYEHPRGNAM
jgi:hypothetical protein